MGKAMKQSTKNRILSIVVVGGMIMTMVVMGIIAVFSLSASAQISAGRAESISAIGEFDDAYATMSQDIKSYLVTGSQSYKSTYLTELNDTKTVQNTKAYLLERGMTDSEASQLDDIIVNIEKMNDIEQQAITLFEARQQEQAVVLIYGQEYQELLAKVGEASNNLVVEIEERTAAESAASTALQTLLVSIIVVLFVIILVFQIIYSRFVAKQLVNPIMKVRDSMSRTIDGDFGSDLDLEVNDSEVGQLANSFNETQRTLGLAIGTVIDVLNRLADGEFSLEVNTDVFIGDMSQIKDSMVKILSSLNSSMSNIRKVATQVHNGSEQVSTAAQTLSQGATEQSSAIQQLSASISQISQQVKVNSENSINASDIVKQAGDSLTKGNEQMEEMLNAMADINGKASEINKIIKTIDDIAFQTNILALNAAVEAARAGASGKGFAVVADEVRNLAAKSAQAAKNTTELIESTIQAVSNGTAIADSTAKTMIDVVEKAKKAQQLTSDIAEASQQQTSALEQVNSGVEQIAGVTETNTATAQETAAASQELFSQSQILERVLSNFSIKEEAGDNDVIEDDYLDFDLPDLNNDKY